MREGTPGSLRKSPAALDVQDVVRLLKASGSRHVDMARVRADIDAGAPTNVDGTINLVHYGAWLARQVAASETSRGH